MLLAVAIVAAPHAAAAQASGGDAAAAPAPVPQPAPVGVGTITLPPPEGLLMLVRNALAALNQANFTGNYTVLHGLGTPALQAAHSPATLAIAFTALRDQNVDLSPALVLSPEVTETPALAADGLLRLVGYVPSQPLRITFAMGFRPVAGRWRIDGLTVSTVAAPSEAHTARPAAASAAGAAEAAKAPTKAPAKVTKPAPN